MKALEDTKKSDELCKEMTKIFQSLPKETDSIQKEWDIFKNAMLKQLQNICGARHPKKDKKTSWWSVEIQKVVQQKKQCFQKWLKSKYRDDYLQYRLARKNAKRVIKEAKVNSWNKYGEHLTDICKTNPR